MSMVDMPNLEVYAYPDGTTSYACSSADKRILMQYTGLKDKNGKEIYEGDVVQVFYDKHPQEKGNEAYTVVIRDMMEDNFTGVGKGLGEIVGNIWEHPDLLK